MGYTRYMISDAAKKIGVEPPVLRYWEEELAAEIPRNEMGHRYYRDEDIRMMSGVKVLKEKGFQLRSIKVLLPNMDQVLQLEQRRLLELRDRLELAVSQEELRRQREEELKKCGETEETDAGAEAGIPKAAEDTDADMGRAAQQEQEGGDASKGKKEDMPREREATMLQEVKDNGTAEVSNRVRMQQFKNIMHEIIQDAMKDSNKELTDSITESVSREFEYQMRRKEMLAEEHFKQLDRTLRECQQGQKQAAVTKEYGGGRTKSKFFRKNGRKRI